MKFKIMSDLHINAGHKEPSPPENAKEITLLIPGDVCEIRHAKLYREYMTYLSKAYHMVLLGLGNHEFYFGSVSDGVQQLRKTLEGLDNVIIMDQKSVVLDNVTVVGATLWTNMNRGNPIDVMMVQRQLNDFRLINFGPPNDPMKFKFSARHCMYLHEEDLKFLDNAILDAKTEKVIVMTHHAPSFGSVAPKWRNSSINAGFYSDLDDFIVPRPIDLWVHGHMHDCFDYYVGKTRVVCNPKGYGDENPLFNPNLILDL